MKTRSLAGLAALWAFVALPLLGLPVDDWKVVCGCDACPMQGGPSCCCRGLLTEDGATSPGASSTFALPTIGPEQAGCVGPATLAGGELRPMSPVAGDPAPADPSASRPLGTFEHVATRSARFPFPSLPRPPPVFES